MSVEYNDYHLILGELILNHSFKPVSDKIFDMANRIIYACEVDGACPCDSDICEL
ncbi:MAG: hypothetical protein KAI40_02985 [Desulfobacterales bacterium]|nr:hypothetical protein [Desulfobacterales bacterium]